LNFKASAAENEIFHGLKTIFLESAVHRLSVDALLVYQKTVLEDKKQVIPCRCIIEKDVKDNIMRFRT
jgi:hypothetical protein